MKAVRAGHRWGVLSRVVAAVVGGYGLAALGASVLALALPRFSSASRADAVLIASLLAFAWYAAVALWVFSTRSAARVWCVLGGWALGLAVLRVALGATG